MFENVFKYYFETVRTAQSVLSCAHETTFDGLLLYSMPLQLHLLYEELGKKNKTVPLIPERMKQLIQYTL